MTINQNDTPAADNPYPGLLKRTKAALLDTVVLIIFMYSISELFNMFDNVSDAIRLSAFIFIFFLYDPLFVSLFGGTVGHKQQDLGVKKEQNELKNISFLSAILRFITKSTLGWLSFLTMSMSSKNKAIHDYVAGSVVVFK
jgi:uncharacterized RDD family membrane protein YckC